MTLKISNIHALPEIEEVYIEMVIFSIAIMMSHLNVKNEDMSMSISHAQKRSDGFYRDIFDFVPRFSQKYTSVSIPLHYLKNDNDNASPMLYKQAISDCDELKNNADNMVTVEQAVRQTLKEGCRQSKHYSLQEIAMRLNMSTRTVSRKLSQANISFRELQSEGRMEQAKEELRASKRPIKAIGSEAGFLSLSAFSRSFRKQVALSPSEYRSRYSR